MKNLLKIMSRLALVILLLLVWIVFSRPAFAAASVPGKQFITDDLSAASRESGVGRLDSKLIVVSVSQQWMHDYANGQEVYSAPVTTGRPELPTPMGTYHVYQKLSPTTFYSPWPQGSPYWYPPTHINYALEWAPGFFLHDSWWRTVYGPGTNVWHNDPVYGRQTGTHGCITMPLGAAQWLYGWAPIGTTVEVVG